MISSRVVLCLGSALLSFSCRQVLGIEERHEGAGTDGGTGATVSGAKCASCREANCADTVAACNDNAECKPTEQCENRCAPGDADCVAWCEGSYARPDSLADLLTCSSGSCTGSCIADSCGELRYGSNACDACLRQNCCAENAACSANSDCAKLEFCEKGCLPAGSAPCTALCQAQYPGGGDDWAARSSCASNQCGAACAGENSWTCLDDRRSFERPAQSGDIVFDMTVVEFLDNSAFQGVTVKACERRDFTCETPFDSTVTDESGHFTLSVPAGSGGFDGFLDVSATTTSATPGKDIYPTLYYFTPPLIAGGNRGRLQIPSNEHLAALAGVVDKAGADPTKGHLALVAWDCTLNAAPGVSFSLVPDDSSAKRYYFSNSLPNLAATETQGNPALGGFVNITANSSVLVRATVASGSRVSSEISYFIRPGTLTTGPMPPSPTL
jgi:hypothetical protein